MKKKSIVLFLSFIFSFTSWTFETVPSYWYVGGEGDEKANVTYNNEEALGKELIDIMDTTEEAISSFDQESIQKSNSSNRKFKFSEVITFFGVTTGGGIGPLGLDGEAVAEISWAKKEDRRDRSKKKKVHLYLSGSSTKMDLSKRIDPLVKALVSSGKVKKALPLKENLLKAANEFKSMMEGVVLPSSQVWNVAAVQANFAVEASGHIGIIGIGGHVELTFEWSFEQNSSHNMVSVSNNHPGRLNKVAKKISEMLEFVTSDIHYTVARAHRGMRNFYATAWEMGFMVGVGGEIGVAQVACGAGFTVVFERAIHGEKSNQPILNENDPSLKGDIFIGALNEDNEKGLRNWIRNRRMAKFKKISRRKFRKGLGRALKIGRYWARKVSRRERSSRGRRSKWGVRSITTVFSMSVEGSVGVVTVSGSPAMEIEFINGNF